MGRNIMSTTMYMKKAIEEDHPTLAGVQKVMKIGYCSSW
jgi:hypothetical protein